MTAPSTGTFQRWVERGVLQGIWAVLIEECREFVYWEWQPIAGKARFGGALLDAIPRTQKAGSKKSILVDGAGGPLSVVVGANGRRNSSGRRWRA